MEGTREYTGGGVLLLLHSNDRDYIVLPKRSRDAEVNPNVHSGFFGGRDLENPEEISNPSTIGIRELHEELLIVSRDRTKTYELVFSDGNIISHDLNPETKTLREIWNKEKEAGIDNGANAFTQLKILEGSHEVEYREHDGWKKILIVKFNTDALENLRFFDGETREDHPSKGLLDRQIDIFNLEEFQKWWLNQDASLLSVVSFKTGRKTERGFVVKDKLSPSLILVLNVWTRIIEEP